MTEAPSSPYADDPLARLARLPTVASAVAGTRSSIDALLGHHVLRRDSARVTAESFLRGARANAAMAGVDWPLERVRAAVVPEDPESALIAGVLRAAGEFGALTRTWPRAPGQVLARLHVLVAADVLDPGALGRPRQIGDDRAGRATRDHQPTPIADPAVEALGGSLPVPSVVSARLDALCRLTASSDAPAVVIAAITHGELLALQPFAWGNGMIARIAERMVIVSRGLDPKSVSAPEVGHGELGLGRYRAALAGYLSGTPGGVAEWVAYCAEAMSLGARESLAVCEALRRQG